MKRLALAILCMLLIVSATACGGTPAPAAKPATPAPAPAKPAEKVIKIGGIAGLQTGFGQSMKMGADLAIEEINKAGGAAGYQFKIEWLDTEGSATTGRTVTQRLLSGGVDAILGCHASTVVLAIADLMEQNKVLEIAMGSAQAVADLKNPWIVRVRETDLLTAKIIANYIVDNAKHKKVGIIYMSEQYGTGGRDNVMAALKAKNFDMKNVFTEAHNPSDKDYTGQLTKFKKAGIDAMVIFSGAGDNGIILKQAKQLLPGVKIYMSSVGATKPVLDVAGAAADGTYAVVSFSADNQDPKVQAFVKAFKTKYNADVPDFFAPLSYDAVYLLANAVKTAGGNDHTKIRDAYRASKGYVGATGLAYNATPDGETVNELLLVQINGGKQTVIAKVAK